MCERSFGIHVAEMAGFPPHVVDLAQKKLREFEGEGEGEEEKKAEREKEFGNQTIPQVSIQPAQSDHARESIDGVVDALSQFDADAATTDQSLAFLTTIGSD